MKCGSQAGLAFEVDGTTVRVDYDLAAECQSDAGAFADGLGSETGAEDFVMILRADASSGVGWVTLRLPTLQNRV